MALGQLILCEQYDGGHDAELSCQSPDKQTDAFMLHQRQQEDGPLRYLI